MRQVLSRTATPHLWMCTDQSTLQHLKTEVLTAKDCTRKTKAGDTVHVHYRGTLESDGSEFDASYNRGDPLAFKVGTGQVIKGWDQGLLDMCPGEKRKLTIQPEWAYGSRGAGPIPANSVLSKLDGKGTRRILPWPNTCQSLSRSWCPSMASRANTRPSYRCCHGPCNLGNNKPACTNNVTSQRLLCLCVPSSMIHRRAVIFLYMRSNDDRFGTLALTRDLHTIVWARQYKKAMRFRTSDPLGH